MDGIADRLSPGDKLARAQALWDEADAELDLTPGGTYLRDLGGKPPWPAALRYSARCWHGPEGVALPALIAKIADIGGALTAIQRTFLTDDGDLAEVVPRRLLLGQCGGGSVHFGRARPGEVLIVTETLNQALQQHYQTDRAAWAALSASGISRLILPDAARHILILPNSDAGRRAAEKSAARWRAEGHSLRIANRQQERDRAAQRHIAIKSLAGGE